MLNVLDRARLTPRPQNRLVALRLTKRAPPRVGALSGRVEPRECPYPSYAKLLLMTRA